MTNFTEVGSDVATASWSSDGQKLAIGYGGPESGVGVFSFNEPHSYFEITSKANNELSTWTYWLDASWGNFLRALAKGKDSTESFTAELVFSSVPIWVNDDQNIVFTAANQNRKAALFIVNADGTGLHELLPGYLVLYLCHDYHQMKRHSHLLGSQIGMNGRG